MRVCLFTDTLGDINGVSRFIRNAGDAGAASGRSLTVITSTRMEIPSKPHFVNVPPLAAMRMPKYEHLEVVLPRRGELRRVATALRPDAIHVSTPGPVGMVGRGLARRLGIPLLGTYHTDFPAYLERLFDDPVLGTMTANVMAWFYRPFCRIFARSPESMHSMKNAGLDPARFVTLHAGTDTDQFHPRHRDPSIWAHYDPTPLPAPSLPSTLRVLSCGRVSIEKNLPMLIKAWLLARPMLLAQGTPAQLVVVGDGPYLSAMRAALSNAPNADQGPAPLFLGFRHGEELSALYASADLFVFPSTTDTLGQAVMEAQASGLPALVSDQGGPKGIIRHSPGGPGQTGLMLPGSDASAWAGAIADLARDRPRREAMGKAAHLHLSGSAFAASFEHFWRVHEQAAPVPVH